MSDRYLWDGSGEPDPEIQKLEEALAPLRHRGSPAAVLANLESPAKAASPRPRGLAAAAVLLAMLGVTASLLHRARPAEVAAGQIVETDARSHKRIDMGEIGSVDVRPRTRLRVLDRRSDRYRLALERGTLRAVIFAPPGEFLVETPSARAVDLGCIYTLSVDDAGAGLLTVEAGWVALEFRGRESFVPAGAQCATGPRRGPGIPYYRDVRPAFRAAVAVFDSQEGSSRGRALNELLEQARPRDAMTLWHLLARVDESDRGRVFDHLAALAPPPPGVTREHVVRGAPDLVDAWWNELGLGAIDFWRAWKAAWPEAG